MSSRIALAPASSSVMSSSTSAHGTDLGERDTPELRAVRHHDDVTGAIDQGTIRVGLDLVMGREAGIDGDPVDADERHVEVEPLEGLLRDRPDELVGLGRAVPPVTTSFSAPGSPALPRC